MRSYAWLEVKGEFTTVRNKLGMPCDDNSKRVTGSALASNTNTVLRALRERAFQCVHMRGNTDPVSHMVLPRRGAPSPPPWHDVASPDFHPVGARERETSTHDFSSICSDFPPTRVRTFEKQFRRGGVSSIRGEPAVMSLRTTPPVVYNDRFHTAILSTAEVLAAWTKNSATSFIRSTDYHFRQTQPYNPCS